MRYEAQHDAVQRPDMPKLANGASAVGRGRSAVFVCALLTVLALLPATALGGSRDRDPVSPRPNAPMVGLSGTRWKAYRILERTVPRGYRADIDFGRRTVKGHAWCNSFTGRYRVSSGFRLRFKSLLTTLIGCGGVDNPPDFYRALLRTRTYTQREGRLILKAAHGKVLARLKQRH
jgi:heat shock protein HslJ